MQYCSQDNDILCPKVTPTFQAGRAAVVGGLTNGVGAASTEVHIVRARPGVAEARFVRYLLLTKYFLEAGESRFQGVAGLQRVPDIFLRDLPVPLLATSEQQSIADFLDDQVGRINRIIAARSYSAPSSPPKGTYEAGSGAVRPPSQVELLQELKRSLISTAVSGEFDVSSASGRGVLV